MGETITLTAEDGFELSAYRAEPEGTPKGGVVVVQEIFGVNSHIRADTDKFAAHGYLAIAPAVFDRIEPGFEVGYDQDGFTRGRAIVGELGFDTPLLDVRAAADAASTAGKVACVGYCWGGTIAFRITTQLGLPAVSYYGGRTIPYVDEKVKAPLLMHFGATDQAIPPEDIEQIRAKHPDVPTYVYDGAGHGFNCSERADYHEAASKLALDRTLEFLAANVG